MVYNYLPLMILPLFVAFDRVGPALREASKDLGAGKLATFFRVTLPLVAPGHHRRRAAGLHPADGRLHHRDGARRRARATWSASSSPSQFQTAQNWALGSAMAVLLMIVIMLTIAVAALLIWLVTLPFRLRTASCSARRQMTRRMLRPRRVKR